MSLPDPALDPAPPVPPGGGRGALRRPRLIASDLDGTIIGYDHSRTGWVSPRTVAAFRAAHDAGIHVVFVTGRPIRWLSPVTEALGHAGPVICSNGAVVYDLVTHTVLESRPMDLATVLEARDMIAALDPSASFGVETLDGFHLEAAFLDDPTAERPPEVARDIHVGRSLEDSLPAAPRVVKFLAKTRSREPDAFLAEVRVLLGELLAVTHSAPGVALLEMSRPDVNKASTLADVAARHGIAAHEVVAFGDMPNDLEMIHWAGTGYAVASGHPVLLQAADATAGACDDDGVAAVIEDLLRLP
ncbi:HAD family hydrolase [Citricoccus sp. SGAir0253]|uniref:HAD family hydrolase n=1 Tax=Citricoccus sp. SGAir0253 TaxID=2567881 RepID=UPI0010CD4F6E|nr:HAD family hydrolase [Citricoccus sp. SGAir0253]QCU76824.1 HAD family hydrolase [Citricoccus sp. SGAir0253]